MPRVLLHVDVLSWLRGVSRGEPRQRAKCLDHLRQLLLTGETPFKVTSQRHNKGWRRSQLFGNRFYLWWAPSAVLRQIAARRHPHENILNCSTTDIYVRTIAYHDDTHATLTLGTHRAELWSELTPELLEEIGARTDRPKRPSAHAGRGRMHADRNNESDED